MTQFYIRLTPQMRDDRLTIEKRGNTLVLNGQEFDPETYNQDDRNQWVVGDPPLCQGSCPLLYFSSISQVGGIGR